MRYFFAVLVGLAMVVFPIVQYPSALAASPVVVYDSVPRVLPPNAPSQPFQAQQTFEFGDHIHLGGTNRKLTEVTVSMSTWALYADYAADARYMSNSVSWSHPITVNIYGSHLGPNGVPDTLLTTRTQTIGIPWRPVADPTCPDTGYGAGFAWRAEDGKCYNGFAFNATIDFDDSGVVLPDDIVVGIAYNTQSYGANPIGSDGPYNSLNVLVPPNDPVIVGNDDSIDRVFWNTVTAGWYADGGLAGTGIFREDWNWTPYGTVALRIKAAPVPVKPDISQCKNGGWQGFHFRNQGLCIQFVNTGKDSR